MDNRPIGIFDSGIGGLTVLGEIRKNLPDENLIYLGDSGRAPYGTKSADIVRKYTFQDINFLLQYDVKMVVIACNTASACSLGKVLEEYRNIPIMEVVGPSAKASVKTTENGKIAVIGTPATISSGVYEKSIKNLKKDCNVFSKACPMFVPLVEEGLWSGEITEKIAEKYLYSLKKENVDTMILGCTHYPYLSETIGKYMGPDVRIINSGAAVAEEVKEKLSDLSIGHEKGNKAWVKYFTSDTVEKFSALGELFLGQKLTSVEHADTQFMPCPEEYSKI